MSDTSTARLPDDQDFEERAKICAAQETMVLEDRLRAWRLRNDKQDHPRDHRWSALANEARFQIEAGRDGQVALRPILAETSRIDWREFTAIRRGIGSSRVFESSWLHADDLHTFNIGLDESSGTPVLVTGGATSRGGRLARPLWANRQPAGTVETEDGSRDRGHRRAARRSPPGTAAGGAGPDRPAAAALTRPGGGDLASRPHLAELHRRSAPLARREHVCVRSWPGPTPSWRRWTGWRRRTRGRTCRAG